MKCNSYWLWNIITCILILSSLNFLRLLWLDIYSYPPSGDLVANLSLRHCLLFPIMLSGVGDNCPRWGCIRTGGGGSGSGHRRRNGGGGEEGVCDGDDYDDDNDNTSLEAYDLATDGARGNSVVACCPGSQCMPTRRHRRRRKSAHGSCDSGRDKSPGKESPQLHIRDSNDRCSSPVLPRSSCCSWPLRCLSLLFSECHRSDCHIIWIW